MATIQSKPGSAAGFSLK